MATERTRESRGRDTSRRLAAADAHEVRLAVDPLSGESQTASACSPKPPHRFAVRADAIVDWFKTLTSAAVYATLLLTFVGQIARVDGLSMEPTLADHDRLVVNKWIRNPAEAQTSAGRWPIRSGRNTAVTHG